MAINSSVTLRRLIQELSEWANGHEMIAKFGYGDILDLYQREERLYPYFMVNCNNQSSDQWYVKYQLEVFVGFWIWDDKSNQDRAESDSNDIIQDLLNTIRISPRWQSFSRLGGEFSGLKIVERTGDKVTGWGGTINLWVKKKSGICDLALLMPEYDFDTQSTVEPGTPFKINGTEVDTVICGETFPLLIKDPDGVEVDYAYNAGTKTATVQGGSAAPVYNVVVDGDPSGTLTFDGQDKTIIIQ